MRFQKIVLIHLLALEASIIKEKYLNEIRETFDESVALFQNKTSMIMTKIETKFEKSEEPCDWSWGRQHACAITGFILGFIGFPMCLCCCGFRPAGVAGGSCAAGIQRLIQ